MKCEEFKKLYDLLQAENSGEYEYDGKDIISTHIYKGIWVFIINDIHIEGKDSWHDCYDLKNANGKLLVQDVLDLQRKRWAIIEDVKRAIDKVIPSSHNINDTDLFDLDSIPLEKLDAAYIDYTPLYETYLKSQEKVQKEVQVSIFPKDILRLDMHYFSYNDGKMAFAVERHWRNYITERLLRVNLKCFGDYEIIGYSKLANTDNLLYLCDDIYHTNLPKQIFDAFLKEILNEEDYAKIDIRTLDYDEFDKYYDDDFE